MNNEVKIVNINTNNQQHLAGMTAEQQKMIKLMAQIFVKSILNNDK